MMQAWSSLRRLTLVLAAALPLTLVAPAHALDRTAATAPATAAAGDVQPNKVFSQPYLAKTLPNGLQVLVVRTANPGVVSLQIPVQTGSRNEIEEGKSGFAHFFEHMMFRGTPNVSADEYGAIIKAAGADQNAYTSADLTNYYTNFTVEDLETMLRVEADRFQNLAFTEEQFRTEALAVKGEYLKNFSNPISKAWERLSDLAYDVHPYGHTTMGYFADIDDMPNELAYSKTFFDRWYRPEYTSVIVVGDVDPAATLALVEKYWGGWKRGSFEVDIPTDPPLAAARYEHIAWEGPTLPQMVHAWRAPALDDEAKDIPALMLLAELYFGPTSELYQRLVVRERLVDSLNAGAPQNKDPGLFTVFVRLTDAKHAQTVVTAIQDTLLAARTVPLEADRLRATQSRLKYSFAASMDTASGLGAILARFMHFERDPETINRLYAQFDAVTPADVVAVANRVFVDSNRASVSVSNAPELAGANGFRPLDAEVAAVRAATKPAIPVLEQRAAEAPLVDVALIFHTGAAFDPPGKRGLAWLTASMLTNAGTAKRSYEEVQQAFYPLAAGLFAQVDKEMVKLSGTVHRDNLEAWYALVREMLLAPGFREEDLARLKQQQANAIRVDLRSNNDEELGKEALYEALYGPEHPYGLLNRGKAGEVEKLTVDDVRAFFAANFNPERLRVGLAGGYDEAFRDRLLADLAKLPAGQPATLDAPPAAMPSARSATVIEKETPAVAVSFGWPLAVKRGDPDWVALWLVRSFLGEHRNSGAWLYNQIREKRGMNYGDYAYIEYFPNGMFAMQPSPNFARDNDLFQVWIRPLRSNNDALFATRTALYEIDKLVRGGLGQANFEATRGFLRKQVAILTAAQGRRLGYALDSAWYGTPEFVDYIRGELDRLTLEQVDAAIRRHFRPENAHFVFVAKDAAGLAAALAASTPSPIEYNTPKPELAEEDAVIASWPLGLGPETVRVVPATSLFE
jgi:zinc protease